MIGGTPVRTRRLGPAATLALTASLLACTACSRRPPAPVAASTPAAESAAVPELAGAPPGSDAPAVADAQAASDPAQPQPADAHKASASDPLQPVNRQLFKADRAVSGLVDRTHVMAAIGHTPAPAVRGVANVIQNLDEPQAAANHLLQRHPGGALKAAARFVINSTIGVAGLFDVANRIGLKHKGADFGQTLAAYGVKPGPYVYVPLAGPSSVRDLVGTVVDGYFWPVHWLSLGPWQQPTVEMAHGGLEHIKPPPGKSLPAPTELASAARPPADAYVAVRTAYQARQAPSEPPKPVQLARRQPEPSLAPTTILAANP